MPDFSISERAKTSRSSEFAELVADVVGYKGKIVYDTSRPDGTPRKLLDVSKINKLGWKAKTELRDGLERAYADFLETGGRAAEIMRLQDINWG